MNEVCVTQRMSRMTYVVEHNPNCPSPFLVRLVGVGKGILDKLPSRTTRDVLGYGQTFEDAAKEALAMKQAAIDFVRSVRSRDEQRRSLEKTTRDT